jgi:hypothetical protein
MFKMMASPIGGFIGNFLFSLVMAFFFISQFPCSEMGCGTQSLATIPYALVFAVALSISQGLLKKESFIEQAIYGLFAYLILGTVVWLASSFMGAVAWASIAGVAGVMLLWSFFVLSMTAAKQSDSE